MYVYIQSDPELWTVGFYTPTDEWKPESDHSIQEEAANRVAFLNGNNHQKQIDEIHDELAEMGARMDNIMINADVVDY